MYTREERAICESADEKRAWPSIPEGCPIEIREHIIEYRARKLGFTPVDLEADARSNTLAALKSL